MDGSQPQIPQPSMPTPGQGLPPLDSFPLPPTASNAAQPAQLPQQLQPQAVQAAGSQDAAVLPGQNEALVDRSAQQAPLAQSPVVAEDVDLIEKEWVVKAKDIVSKTRDDPRKQNTEINRMKADYLKTRYSKDIKVNES